ncbi:MAG: hypothetical protein QNJ46_24970, partial [Leptolyngbyaceae cyanobacterium MO_188.B28]|nr:hypothetical protein [Leptolyngbyaceae cyanobacterium MO_188.B28]
TVWSVSFSPDGQTLASASQDETVKLWNRDGALLETLVGHRDTVWSVSFSPDGQTFASASKDKTVKLWNRDGALLKTFLGHSNQVSTVSFSHDGQTLASASYDGTVKLWSLDLNKLLIQGCDWLNDYFVLHPQDLRKLKICQNPPLLQAAAPALVTQGEAVAREGNVEEATSMFHQALEWNPDIDLDPETNTLDRDPEAVAQTIAAIEKGKRLAKEGEVDKAIAKFQEVQALVPDMELNPVQASSWNALCWYGSLQGYASDVMFACEKAVKLDPNNGSIIDSRGLARAITGNTQGAIDDFQTFINWTVNPSKKALRQTWIKALEQGENPFTEEVLERLRN